MNVPVLISGIADPRWPLPPLPDAASLQALTLRYPRLSQLVKNQQVHAQQCQCDAAGPALTLFFLQFIDQIDLGIKAYPFAFQFQGLLLVHFSIRQLWSKRLTPGPLTQTASALFMRYASSNGNCRKLRPFPSEHLPVWRDALQTEIACGRCVSSRGRANPRGVKREMSNFGVRHRGEILHRFNQPTPSLCI